MPRKPRIEFSGAVYHVMSRGNGGQDIFLDDGDREIFLKTLEEAIERCGWRLHAYVMMGNHYHLLLETPDPNLVVGMKWLQGTYTQRFNVRHRRHGHLFQGRYKAIPVSPEEEGYWETVSTYIHLNPIRAGLLGTQEADLATYAWSSYPAYVQTSNRPPWLHVGRVLDALRLADSPTGRNAYRQFINKHRLEIQKSNGPDDAPEAWKEIRRGWFLGTREFRNKLELLLDEQVKAAQRSSYSGEQVRQHDERAAEAWLQAGLKALGIDEALMLGGRIGSDEKCLLAWLIRRRTHVANAWIARRLEMGRADCLSRYPQRIQDSQDRNIAKLRAKLSKITILRD
jgi:putative transposase